MSHDLRNFVPVRILLSWFSLFTCATGDHLRTMNDLRKLTTKGPNLLFAAYHLCKRASANDYDGNLAQAHETCNLLGNVYTEHSSTGIEQTFVFMFNTGLRKRS